jgi:hypothetical protein
MTPPEETIPSLLPPDVLRHGTGEPLDPRRPLRAGPLALTFDPHAAWLRHVRLGEREVLRAVYVAVRDPFWRTVPTQITNLSVREEADGFTLTFDAECCRGPIDFAWRGEVTGDAAGTITYRMDGQARSTFLRARIGFCVLHPVAECAGRPCTVEHPDGTTERGTFPAEIAPHQPFHDVRAMTHEVAEGVSAEVRFEGDVFETEDQRNWTDASFKTYCTPLKMPWPVEVPRGRRISQAVTLRLREPVAPALAAVPSEPRPQVSPSGSTLLRLPRIGFGLATLWDNLTAHEVELLRALRPGHVRIDLRPRVMDDAGILRRAAARANALGAALEVALLLSDDPEPGLRALAEATEQVRPPVGAWLVCRGIRNTGTEEGLRLARRYLAPSTPQARFGLGTNGYFTELNRQRPAAGAADFVFFSLNPQVHAFDDLSVMEALDGQQWVGENARRLAGGRPVAVTPITLRPRFNPHAAAAGIDPLNEPGELPSAVDVRQMSLFAAAWTLASVRRLALAGVASLTYFETTGWRGVIEAADGPPLPERFPSLPGAVFPMYHVLADLAEFVDGPVDLCRCSRLLEVEALSFSRETRRTTLIANLSSWPQVAAVPLGPGRVRVLDATTAELAMRSPEAFRRHPGARLESSELHLGPYAVARIDQDLPAPVPGGDTPG